MIKRFASVLLGMATLIMGSGAVEAATPRSSWVQNEIYQYNHPFASQLPGELATKMQTMAVSPFAFYRGTAHIFYKDMITLPRSSYTNNATDVTWLIGDMHLQNTGAFRNNNGNDIFDTNDSDEGYLGSYVWDVRRMAVSILLAAKENGIGSTDRQDIVRSFLDAYLNKMSDFKGTDQELSYGLNASNTTGVVNDLIQKVATNTRSNLLGKYTTLNSSGKRVFQNISELQTIPSVTYSSIVSSMNSYISSIATSKRYSNSFYAVKDIRLKLGSGTGSLGRYRYYVLIEGATSSSTDDVILEMKQETASAVSIAAPDRLPAYFYDYHEGKRAVISMKALQSNTDVLLGYTTVDSIPFLIREKSPYKEGFDYTLLITKSKFTDAVVYIGKILAKDHALADKDYDPAIVPYSEDKEITDATELYRSAFKAEVLNFALDYATQVEYDYNSFKTLYQNGSTLY